MRDITMLKVTMVTDDSTGIWQVGEVEFAICLGPLCSFLKQYGKSGAEEIKKTLDHLKSQVDYYLEKTASDDQGGEDG